MMRSFTIYVGLTRVCINLPLILLFMAYVSRVYFTFVRTRFLAKALKMEKFVYVLRRIIANKRPRYIHLVSAIRKFTCIIYVNGLYVQEKLPRE